MSRTAIPPGRAGSAAVRALVLVISLMLMAGLLIAWWVLRSRSHVPEGSPRVSVLERSFPEPEYSNEASSDQLLQLAERELEDLLGKWPASAKALNIKANRDFLVSDTAGARQAWEQALKYDPTNADALFGLANLAFEAGDYQKSARICEQLRRTHPGNPRVPLLLADSYLHDAKPETAVFTLEQHITSEPASVQAWQMLGNAQLNLGNYDKAISCFERALSYDPDSKDAYYGLGQAYVRTGKTQEAKDAMQRFQELAKASSEQSTMEAQAFVDRAYAAHVAAQVLVDGAVLFKEEGDLATAEEKLLRALKLQPDVIAWLQELELVYQQQGKLAEAADVLERLAKLEPDKLDHRLRLGGLYAELNQPAAAVAALRQAIDIDPSDPRCMQAKQVIEQIEQEL